MAVSKVVYGGETLVDLTSDTVTANDLAEGVTATAADGTQITGLLPKVEIDSALSSTSTNPVQNKVINEALSGYLPFVDSYISDADAWLTNGYTKTSRFETTNLPSVCKDASKWGILFFIAENAKDGTGTQMFFPINGTYQGRIFVRSVVSKVVSTWTLIPIGSDFATVATSGSYNDLTNKPTIPSAYTLPTASASTLGGVKVGTGLSINTSGVLSNSYSYTLPNATASVLGGVKVGSNITVSSGTISLTKANVTSALGYTPPASDTTYSVATTSANGLMSSTDKSKLDGIATGANNYTHPSTHPASMITGLASVATSGSYNDLSDTPTIPSAITVDTSLSSTSTNPVQNKAVYAELQNKVSDGTTGFALSSMTGSIKWRQGSQYGASISGTQYTGNAATATKATQDADGNVISSTYAKSTDLASIETPVGTVLAYAGNTMPSGYLQCNGAAISRTTYANLFAAIGATYGSGDGSTTFNLPNLTDKVIQGSSTSGTIKSAGLPNITGTVIFDIYGVGRKTINADINDCEGAFVRNESGYQSTANTLSTRSTSTAGCYCGVSLDASSSNTIYGSSETVQPPALTMCYIIKY